MDGGSLPMWVKPQLCKLVDEPPDGSEWLHEIKYDGYRMHARLDRGRIQLLTRTGLDWTHKYPSIAAALSVLPAKQAYLDGELCGIRSDGKTSFSMIQTASDTGNAGALVLNAVGEALEHSENAVSMFGLDTNAVIFHPEANSSPSGFASHRDPRDFSGRHKFNRIAKQIGNRLGK